MVAQPVKTGQPQDLPLADGMNRKQLQRLPLITFIASALFMFIGVQFSLPRFTFLALLFIGVTALLVGIQAIFTKEVFFLPTGEHARRRRSELYSGLTAQLWGVLFLLFELGFVIGGAAAIFIPEQAQATIDRLFESAAGWGLLLTLIGVLVSLYGATRLLAGAAAVSRAWYGAMQVIVCLAAFCSCLASPWSRWVSCS